jgi:mRNA interferase MazF
MMYCLPDTSQAVSDSYAIPLRSTDFTSGRLAHDSNIRPNRLFTADSNIILYRAGVLTPAKLQEVIAKIITIVRT